jgi:putative peptidoglycan lipid II flippase
VGIAVGTTLLPLLSRHADSGAEENFRHYTSRALEFCLMLGLPAMIGSIILAEPIVQTLFEHGVFGPEDTHHTAEALMAYSLGVPGFLIIKVFAAGFFARHDLALPVKLAMIGMLVNVIGAVLMLHSLEHIGIALAGSLATTTNASLLYLYHKLRGQRIADDKFMYRLPRILFCAVAMAGATAYLAYLTRGFFIAHHLPSEITGLALSIGGSMIFYGLMLQLTKAMSWKDALGTLRRKNSSEALARSGPDLGSETGG